MEKKYGYASAVGSSVVVRDNQEEETKKTIGTIQEVEQGLLFLNAALTPSRKVAHVNIHLEFFYGKQEDVNEEAVLQFILNDTMAHEKTDHVSFSYTN